MKLGWEEWGHAWWGWSLKRKLTKENAPEPSIVDFWIDIACFSKLSVGIAEPSLSMIDG
jgi:hypothetical protein